MEEAPTEQLPKTYILTTEAIEKQWIDPMIGMEQEAVKEAFSSE